jgi:hypothetical protein
MPVVSEITYTLETAQPTTVHGATFTGQVVWDDQESVFDLTTAILWEFHYTPLPDGVGFFDSGLTCSSDEWNDVFGSFFKLGNTSIFPCFQKKLLAGVPKHLGGLLPSPSGCPVDGIHRYPNVGTVFLPNINSNQPMPVLKVIDKAKLAGRFLAITSLQM